MNRSNERLTAILAWLRKMPRWALILTTLMVFVVLGIAMFFLIPQQQSNEQGSGLQLSTGLAFGVFLKLLVVVLIIIGCAILIRRWQSKTITASSKQINLVETLHLSPRRSLYLVNVEGHKILIGATDQSMNNLLEYSIEDKKSIDSEINQSSEFADLLQKAKQEKHH